jgi:hypothetical protein
VPEFDEAWRDEEFPDPRARRAKLRAYDGDDNGREAPARIVDWADEVGMGRISRDPRRAPAGTAEVDQVGSTVDYHGAGQDLRYDADDYDWRPERNRRAVERGRRRAERHEEPPTPDYDFDWHAGGYAYDRRPDRSEYDRRLERSEYDRRLERSEYDRRPDRSEADYGYDYDDRPERDHSQPAPSRVPGANGVTGRRTVTIRGQVAPRPVSRQPARRAEERVGSRPDRIAMWAVLLCVVMILVAATSSHAAVLAHGHAAVHHAHAAVHYGHAALHHAHASVARLAHVRAR